MAHHIQSSFSAGELDPALHERTGFDKYQAGLKTLRNTVIGKTGRMISRAGKMHFLQTRDATAVAGTFTAAATDICTKAGHVYGTGTLVTLTNSGGALPAGLSAATNYYVIWLTKDTFSLAASLADASAGTAVNITGTGTGTHTITPTDIGSKESILYSPEYSNYVVEFGERYIRVHNVIDGGYVEEGHYFTEEDLDYIQFIFSKTYLYILRAGERLIKMTLSTATVVVTNETFYDGTSSTVLPRAPIQTASATTGTGYQVEYAFTAVHGGQESLSAVASSYGNLPILNAEKVTFTLNCGTTMPTEVRGYRRPNDGTNVGGAFGFIGVTAKFALSGSDYLAYFEDIGNDADYTHSPPTLVSTSPAVIDFKPRAGVVYQQRLVLTRSDNEEAIVASRTGYQTNFLRDYPLGSDSSLEFKCGETDNAKVLRFVNNNGLLAFTTAGIYQNSGPLSPDNLSMDHKGNWVIEETVPPLKVPGGLLFVDKSANTIRSLIFSNEAGGFPGEELSIFSNHLFENKTIKSWAFQDGDIPLIWVVMDDGSLNTLTYQREHQMQAWSRHDTDGLYESVCVQKNLDDVSVPYFIVNRDGTRYIEYGADRFVADIKDFVCMDSATTFKSEITETGAVILGVRPNVTVTAADINDWTGSLTLTSDVAIFANSASNGAVGTIFRFFDSEGSAVDLTVTTYTSTTVVVVTPSCEFPSSETESITLYRTYTELTGLTHLAEKQVSILSDGYVLASPLNNIDGYPEVFVSAAGTLTLPNGARGAIVHVGLPYASDIETLDIDTVEQKPTLVESMIVNRIMMKILNSRGLYIGSEFPVNDYVDGMTDAETRTEDFDLGNIGNAAQPLTTKRLDLAIDNDWKSQGRICIRQVDPLPFEILSIIPDLTVQWRR